MEVVFCEEKKKLFVMSDDLLVICFVFCLEDTVNGRLAVLYVILILQAVLQCCWLAALGIYQWACLANSLTRHQAWSPFLNMLLRFIIAGVEMFCLYKTLLLNQEKNISLIFGCCSFIVSDNWGKCKGVFIILNDFILRYANHNESVVYCIKRFTEIAIKSIFIKNTK